MTLKKTKKVAILGSGSIGATVAYSLLLRCPEIELEFLNRTERKAWAKAFDMSHCTPDLCQPLIHCAGIEECHDADVLVITAGVLPAATGSRTDVLSRNVEIFRQCLPTLARNNPQAVLVNVTNPVDIMAYAAQQVTGFPSERVIGSGTALDSLRLRHFIAQRYGLLSADIAIDIIGEHGDTMVPVWSRATCKGQLLTELLSSLAETKPALIEQTRRAGWQIRQAGEHSSYAIAFSATCIVEALLEKSERHLLVSTLMQGENGVSGSYLSLPTSLGPSGVMARHSLPLSKNEEMEFSVSAEHVRNHMREVDTLLSS